MDSLTMIGIGLLAIIFIGAVIVPLFSRKSSSKDDENSKEDSDDSEESSESEEEEEDDGEPQRECAFQTRYDNQEEGKWDCEYGNGNNVCDKSICPIWKDNDEKVKGGKK